ncbi:MAG: hypothetical protein AAF384_02890 [Pseudomonadota bacterium]
MNAVAIFEISSNFAVYPDGAPLGTPHRVLVAPQANPDVPLGGPVGGALGDIPIGPYRVAL